ncbi:uncharacterized protein EDB93DRAFT_1241853 [Suillus bovinus]|uniref:uncharacterized protein n=1 Tax=Suillus bovinus TaxID=48563 RepID=UPI001B86B925|nr:uncharacterized protein EDB93DRAFT_1241853 [Suillus bovinus]KAG2140480.1 hypothetical protein EDB93DRAFT_1241853 [Suillus bovinus]
MVLPSLSPTHLLRWHSNAVSILKAHTNSLLGIEDWDSHIMTLGRDNKIHIWARPEESASIRQGHHDMLLSGCSFLGATKQEGLLAVPNLVESALADIWTLPSRQRLHVAIGDPQDTFATPGIIMSVHLFYALKPAPSSSMSTNELRLLCAYEDGSVVLRKCTAPENKQFLWKSKIHVESVMAMAVSAGCTFALTMSADHLVGRDDLVVAQKASEGTVFKTKHPGNGAITIRGDGRICTTGGWDGKVRLYSTKTFKSCTLAYHKHGCQAVTFANLREDESCGDEDEMTTEEKHARARWLIAGSTDTKVSIWASMKFEKSQKTNA